MDRFQLGRQAARVAVGRSDGTYVARTLVTDAELSRGVVRAWAVLATLGLLLILLGLVVAGADALAVRQNRDQRRRRQGIARARTGVTRVEVDASTGQVTRVGAESDGGGDDHASDD